MSEKIEKAQRTTQELYQLYMHKKMLDEKKKTERIKVVHTVAKKRKKLIMMLKKIMELQCMGRDFFSLAALL